MFILNLMPATNFKVMVNERLGNLRAVPQLTELEKVKLVKSYYYHA